MLLSILNGIAAEDLFFFAAAAAAAVVGGFIQPAKKIICSETRDMPVVFHSIVASNDRALHRREPVSH